MHLQTTLLKLAHEWGLNPKLKATTNGGEYHAACPSCGGKDRFILWPLKARYWCRQCNRSGDSIQFCRDFFHMSFKEACYKAKQECIENFYIPEFSKQSPIISIAWQTKADDFIQSCHSRLMCDSDQLQKIKARGFTIETLIHFKIGWNPITRFDSYVEWGLPLQYKQNGQERRLWLPQGFVIPTFLQNRPIKLKIRTEGKPKYIQVTGSAVQLSFFRCSVVKPHVLLESEFDTMLLCQEAGDLCSPVALGGATHESDAYSHEFLQKAPLILYALDFDMPGKKAYAYWKSLYPHLFAWPTPYAKSVGDAFKDGCDLRKWVGSGIAHCDQRLQAVS